MHISCLIGFVGIIVKFDYSLINKSRATFRIEYKGGWDLLHYFKLVMLDIKSICNILIKIDIH